jgi:arylsulfatase A-like enzyme
VTIPATTRRNFLKLSLTALPAISFARHVGAAETAPRKLNILFVFSDQHRWCDLGCAGNAEVLTPNFDRLAARGVNIGGCISHAPLCVPARGSLLTGLYPLKHRAVANDLPVDPSAPSVAQALARSGYHTGYLGKWHLNGVPRDSPVPKERRLGFTEWKVNNCHHGYTDSFYFDEENQRHGTGRYDAEAYTSLGIDFIERGATRDQPWGLWLAWGPPHDPYQDMPPEDLARYEGKSLPLRPNVPDRIVDRLDIKRFWDLNKAQQNLQGYYAHITALDAQFGRLIDALERTGQLDNTIVIYTSDHGDQLGSQGFTNKQLPYEESIRVPLLAAGPGITTGITSSALISLPDLPVSLLALAGVALPEADGADRSAVLAGTDTVGSSACYIADLVPCHQSAARGTPAWRGVRTSGHTYACRDDGTPWLLFDNTADPFQRHNLVDDPARAALQRQLHAATAAFAQRHDSLTPWPDLLRARGLVEAWNTSQEFFGLPVLGDHSPP